MTNPRSVRLLIAASALLAAALAPGLSGPATVGATPVPAPPATEAQAAPAATEVQAVLTAEIQHYNVCGSACTDSQALRSLELAAWNFGANGAWVLSLNEICGTDFLQLATITGAEGSFVVSKREASGCNHPTDKAFGNGILAIGPNQGGQAWYLPTNPNAAGPNGTDIPCDGNQPASVECRTMLCVKRGTYAGYLGYCTTHFSSAASATLAQRQTQANEYAWLSTGYAGNLQRFLMGDFNLNVTPPANEVPSGYSAGFNDLIPRAAYTYNALAGESLDRHIDYIWAIKPLIGVQWPLCPADRSDHCWTHATPSWSS